MSPSKEPVSSSCCLMLASFMCPETDGADSFPWTLPLNSPSPSSAISYPA